MNALPTEIIDLIVSEVHSINPRVSGLATVSRAWQSSFERHTFNSLQLNSAELDQFAEYLHGHRRHHLRRLRFTVLLPEYPDSVGTVFEDEKDRQQNDIAFSDAIHRLFGVLASWDPDDSFELHIDDVLSPSDPSRRNKSPMQSWSHAIQENGHFYMRYRFSYVNLLRGPDLPSVSCIHHLEVNLVSWLYRKLAAQCPMEIAAKLPNLQVLRAKVADSDLTYPALRQFNRNGLGDFLQTWDHSTTLRDLSLDLSYRQIDNQHVQPARLTSGEDAADPVSRGIAAATSRMANLTSLRVRGVVDASLFQPPISNSMPTTPFWQNLTTLHISFNLESPSGEWYFRSPDLVVPDRPALAQVTRTSRLPPTPPGYGSSPDEIAAVSCSYSFSEEFIVSGRWLLRSFRLVPDDAVLLPLVESFAGACAQIPGLKTAALATVLVDSAVVSESQFRKSVVSDWGVYFAAPGVPSGWWVDLQEDGAEGDVPDEDLGHARLTLNTRGWVPGGDTMALLRSIPTGGALLEEKHVDLWETVVKVRHMTQPRDKIKETVEKLQDFFLDPVVDPDYQWKSVGKD